MYWMVTVQSPHALHSLGEMVFTDGSSILTHRKMLLEKQLLQILKYYKLSTVTTREYRISLSPGGFI